MRIAGSVLVGFCLLLSGCALRAESALGPLPEWLAGCWVSSDGQSLEAWTLDADDTLIGFSSVTNGNAVVFYELMSIRRDAQGALMFTAYPSNQPDGSFPVEDWDTDQVVFFNDAHDYPQRIRYQRQGDRLFADISRADGSDRRNFVKQRCP